MEPGGRVWQSAEHRERLPPLPCVDTSFLFEMSWPACSQISKDKLVSRVPGICSVLTKCAP